MKKGLFILIVLWIGILLNACSNDAENSTTFSDRADFDTEESAEMVEMESNNSISGGSDGATEQAVSDSREESVSPQEGAFIQTNRKIIYTANLQIEVKNFQQTLNTIQSQVANRGGYIVDSNMQGYAENDSINGHVTVRIPQDQFREFIQVVEDGSSKVLESSISGQDVTEEFIDLESRLKSKRVVEERLLSFMEQAEKTEDLLTISADLAKVQGEMEEITGRMNYLENRTDLATVTIYMEENNVTISGMSEGELDTWEKTKKQFLNSINFILAVFSGIFVFFIGNLPVFILLGIIAMIVFFIYRGIKKNNQND
ncbi:DUF4349 domain-containing protein [Oceanobacillus saliphilus]|uniref:DUF4349 domain-containing protein n=1 Tax=Oceanobacillus saliphilus TaxID=2925834 RepID=UPI00201D4CB0|nr:DUF4349 domain-containing protein [Oceanobacillus saliphilus]